MKPQHASTTAKLIAAAMVMLHNDPRTRGLVAAELQAHAAAAPCRVDPPGVAGRRQVFERVAEGRWL